MASFLPLIVIKKNEETKKNMFFIAVYLYQGPSFIIQKTNKLLLILVTFACSLKEYKKLVDFPCKSPSSTCIGKIRALWPTR